MKRSELEKIIIVIFAIAFFIVMHIGFNENNRNENVVENNKISYQIENIPEYDGEIYVQINNNIPRFSAEDMYIEEDYYSSLKNGKVRYGND